MTSVQSVNVGLGLADYSNEATTPTTPRAPVVPTSHAAASPPNDNAGGLGSSTPTNLTFAGINGQRPLPTSPFSGSFSPPDRQSVDTAVETSNKRDSQLSIQSNESQDVEMADSDGEGGEISDGEGMGPDAARGSKKKKGQRFFCTDFPPCKLSFTRSEHLARHIRKHTGERPFQCHCSRRFSRLDNLRQHAQTVHVNEEIPMGSLAATGTRFQRQIRTDRVPRPPGSRPRANTGGSSGSIPRGHSRNLSASSVGSTASTISRDDGRRRPAPLIMANDPSKSRLTLDVLRDQTSTPPGQGSFFRDESEGLSTPTSTTFSTGGNSPGYGSSIGSPASNVRNSGYWDGRGHNRRLSVPVGPMPFQSPQSTSYGSPYLSPLASSQASNFSNLSSSFGSPTNVAHTIQSREAAEMEIRRRTWHPTPHTYTNYSRPTAPNFSRPATSGLSYHQTPDAPHPSYSHNATAAASQSQRLPGIETFDQGPLRSAASPSRGPTHTQADPPNQPPLYAGSSPQPHPGPSDRRGHASWDLSLHQNLTKLDLKSGGTPQESQPWTPQTQQYEARLSVDGAAPSLRPAPIIHQDTMKRPAEELDHPSPNPNRAKRQGWYAGPPILSTTSHPRASPGESTSSEGIPKTPSGPPLEHHPSIVHSNGFVETNPPRSIGVAESHVRGDS
ncbi:uncharacterized protein KY384_006040 [Bacidia gigantensis]|uniref:uncharacterized protein n=1 Tax=Bacidia gigantensis TaxID=2732470 RepID=UPI001D05BF77|nr:uncharacterized protein KY384_006040 [Bacidia gigantensis]KAG8529403.1 hypothetical protein KY384_006040 [Bacidia gigantensis]